MIREIRESIKKLEDQIAEIQSECSHPLGAREAVNDGRSGEVWETGDYWTNHFCNLCEKSWETSQNWRSSGDGKGLPEAPSTQQKKEE